MRKYIAYQAKAPDGEITWFRTNEEIAAGQYVRGFGSKPNVYISDSVAALIIQVGDALHAAARAKISGLSVSGMDDDKVLQRLTKKLTEELVARLSNEDDPIWQDNPDWLAKLKLVSTG